MSNPLISVIVPIYNVEKYVGGCIESILNQTYANIEVFLVDDGSTDRSGLICDEYAQKDPRVTVIHQENQKASKARNAGLDRCSGEYISFIDGDDTVEPDIYSQCMEYVQAEDLDVVVFNCNVDRNGVKEKASLYFPGGTVKSGEEMRDISLLDLMGGQVCFKLYSRKCFENVRFPVGRIYSDLAISHLTYANIRRVGFLDQNLYNYAIRSTGTSLQPKPYKNYHIFLGFREKFIYAKDRGLDLTSKCLAKAAKTAIAVHSDYAIQKWEGIEDYLADTLDFLKENKKQIIAGTLSFTDKMACKLLLTWKGLYYFMYRILKR